MIFQKFKHREHWRWKTPSSGRTMEGKEGKNGRRKGRKHRCQHFSSHSVEIVRRPLKDNQSCSMEDQGYVMQPAALSKPRHHPTASERKHIFPDSGRSPEGKREGFRRKTLRLEQEGLLLPSASPFLEFP